MISRDANTRYIILNTVGNTEGIEQYLCFDEKNMRKVSIIKFIDREKIYKYMGYFVNLSRIDNFTDLQDFFTIDGEFYIILRYNDGERLSEQIDSIKFYERVNIFKSLLEVLIINNVPVFFARQSISPEKILINDEGKAGFHYILDDFENVEDKEFDGISQALNKLVKYLFKEELEIESIENLRLFQIDLNRNAFESCIEIYTHFMAMYNDLMNLSLEETKRPNTKIFRVWNAIKSKFKYIKGFIVVILIAVAITFLILTIDKYNKKNTSQTTITKIGTLKLNRDGGK